MRGLCSSLLLLVWFPAAARTEGLGEPRRHDSFFFRFSIGPGTAIPAIQQGGAVPRVEFSGASIDLDLAAGWSVREDLALHATVFGWNLSNPNVEQQPFPSGELRGNVILNTYGVGATWYTMPLNLYLTASVGVGRVRFDFPDLGVGDRTKPGVAFTAGTGKEWWISEFIGIGMGGYFTYFSAKDSTVPENWSGPGYGLRACMTLN
jgi:hypothetical protein